MSQYMGRPILGESVPLLLRTQDAGGTPTLPSDSPQWRVWQGATLVASGEMPIIERETQTGTFFLSLFLGPLYAAGSYLCDFRWVLPSGYIGTESTNFEITAGGHADGSVVAMYFFSRPHADFVVQQAERGNLLPGKNPSL